MLRSIAVAFAFLIAVSSFGDDAAEKYGPRLSLLVKNRSLEGLVVEKTARGVKRAHLHGRFQHALVLRIRPDGSASIECVDSPEREAALLSVKRDPAPEE